MSTDSKPGAILIIGTGGMGIIIAKRIACGRLVILADYSETSLASAVKQLEDDGNTVVSLKVDVSSQASVNDLASTVGSERRLQVVVHTAGISPAMASCERIFEVDLLGTAIVIDTFADIISPGGSLVCIASMAGHSLHGRLAADAEEHFAKSSLDTMLSHPILSTMGKESTGHAYSLSKRANQLRVQAAARTYGAKGVRINSVSPGVIYTPMLKTELDASHGQAIKDIVEDSPSGRYGTPSDIASAVAFLIGPDASFITGTDLLVDGGSTANQKWPIAA